MWWAFPLILGGSLHRGRGGGGLGTQFHGWGRGGSPSLAHFAGGKCTQADDCYSTISNGHEVTICVDFMCVGFVVSPWMLSSPLPSFCLCCMSVFARLSSSCGVIGSSCSMVQHGAPHWTQCGMLCKHDFLRCSSYVDCGYCGVEQLESIGIMPPFSVACLQHNATAAVLCRGFISSKTFSCSFAKETAELRFGRWRLAPALVRWMPCRRAWGTFLPPMLHAGAM